MAPQKYNQINQKSTSPSGFLQAVKVFLLISGLFLASFVTASNLPAPTLSAAFSGQNLSFTVQSDFEADGYNLYLDDDYQSTHTAQPVIATAHVGGYCVVSFQRNPSGEVDFSVCSNTVFISENDISGRMTDPAENPAQEQQAGVLPQGLRAEVFSRTALELYWDRAPGDTAYTVSRDGQIIGMTSGTSFWSPGLSANTSYDYEVDAGTGTPARLTVATTNPGSQVGTAEPAEPSAPAPANNDNPAAVQSLRIEFYSPTVAELFWQHAPGVVDLDEYRVSLNGLRIGGTIGTSLFIPQLAVGREHRFEVVTVEVKGVRVYRPAWQSVAITRTVPPTQRVPPTQQVLYRQPGLIALAVKMLFLKTRHKVTRLQCVSPPSKTSRNCLKATRRP